MRATMSSSVLRHSFEAALYSLSANSVFSPDFSEDANAALMASLFAASRSSSNFASAKVRPHYRGYKHPRIAAEFFLGYLGSLASVTT